MKTSNNKVPFRRIQTFCARALPAAETRTRGSPGKSGAAPSREWHPPIKPGQQIIVIIFTRHSRVRIQVSTVSRTDKAKAKWLSGLDKRATNLLKDRVLFLRR